MINCDAVEKAVRNDPLLLVHGAREMPGHALRTPYYILYKNYMVQNTYIHIRIERRE